MHGTVRVPPGSLFMVADVRIDTAHFHTGGKALGVEIARSDVCLDAMCFILLFPYSI